MTTAELAEAVTLGVQIYGTPLPTSDQWRRVREDLLSEIPAGRWWRQRRWGCSLVVVKGLLTSHPAYQAIPDAAVWSGSANPVPVISADLAYPVMGGHGGVSVALHECGHAVCEVLTTHGPESLRHVPMWNRNDYRRVFEVMDPVRIDRQPFNVPGEYWAQDYASFMLWTMRRDDRIPFFLGPTYYPVRQYMKGVLYSAGFRWHERPE